MRSADEAIKEIEKYRYTEDDGLAEWLQKNVSMTNFKDIADRLSYLE
jgi:hypothetical protein